MKTICAFYPSSLWESDVGADGELMEWYFVSHTGSEMWYNVGVRKIGG